MHHIKRRRQTRTDEDTQTTTDEDGINRTAQNRCQRGQTDARRRETRTDRRAQTDEGRRETRERKRRRIDEDSQPQHRQLRQTRTDRRRTGRRRTDEEESSWAQDGPGWTDTGHEDRQALVKRGQNRQTDAGNADGDTNSDDLRQGVSGGRDPVALSQNRRMRQAPCGDSGMH